MLKIQPLPKKESKKKRKRKKAIRRLRKKMRKNKKIKNKNKKNKNSINRQPKKVVKPNAFSLKNMHSLSSLSNPMEDITTTVPI